MQVFVDQAIAARRAARGAARCGAGAARGMRETVFTMEATPVKYSRRPPSTTRAGSSRASASAACCSSPIRASPRPGTPTRPRVAHRRRPRRRRLRPRARRADARLLEEAAAFATRRGVDGFVSVGGGSSIDSGEGHRPRRLHPGVIAYVNAPASVRRAARPGRCASRLPTTTGSGSAATTVAVLRPSPTSRVKTGTSRTPARCARRRRSSDPCSCAATAPAEVVAFSTGLDVIPTPAEWLPRASRTSRHVAGHPQRPAALPGRPTRWPGGRRRSEYGGRCLRAAVGDGGGRAAR